jgi:ketose-bisphosphate aldolase
VIGSAEIVRRAWRTGTAVPGFNIPYLPMMAPVVEALRDTACFGFIMVARLEWVKFEAGSVEAIRAEYERVKDERFARLHLDHVPVIDEDHLRVDFEGDIGRALAAGYDSVMVDASRLPLEENIAATRRIVEMAHARGVPVEAELGAVMGHEAGPLPPYDELFASGRGFTHPDEAVRFVRETNVDWLSVAIGSVHGAISAARSEKKIAARLDIPHLQRLRAATGIPLVLHGGTGIPREYVLESIRNGIAKINVATAIRQPYEAARAASPNAARRAVYEATVAAIEQDLDLKGTARRLLPEA